VRVQLDAADAAAPGCRSSWTRSSQDLPVGDRQRLEILKALVPRRAHPDPGRAHRSADTAGDRAAVRRAARLREQGTTVLLITHKLQGDHARCAIEVTVMRAGRVVQELPIAQASRGGTGARRWCGRKVQIGRVAAQATAVAGRQRC